MEKKKADGKKIKLKSPQVPRHLVLLFWDGDDIPRERRGGVLRALN